MGYIKALISGALATSVVIGCMFYALLNDMLPFYMPPAEAYALRLGLPSQPTGIIIQFVTGIYLSFLFWQMFEGKMTILKGVLFGIALWLILQVVVAPVIGWGFFGTNSGTTTATSPFELTSTWKFIFYTFIFYVIYGLIIGICNSRWLNNEKFQWPPKFK